MLPSQRDRSRQCLVYRDFLRFVRERLALGLPDGRNTDPRHDKGKTEEETKQDKTEQNGDDRERMVWAWAWAWTQAT